MRARSLGIPFVGTPGPLNAITDVDGVAVGHCTRIEGDDIRTGVTAILPRGSEICAVPGAYFSLNGNGEMTGTLWMEESGLLGGPILMSNTMAIAPCMDGAFAWVRSRHPAVHWFGPPIVTETYDGFLNDIRGRHIGEREVFAALDAASGGTVAEGNVGGGTGMVLHKFKGGIGTASRVCTVCDMDWTVGVLVQANHGARDELLVAGVPVGLEITDLLPAMPDGEYPKSSIIIVIATDAPLLPHQLKRLAKRATLGLGRTGGMAHNWSGDLFIAFSTARVPVDATGIEAWRALPNPAMDPLFSAVVYATEEAITNALVTAETMTGRGGNTYHAIPHGRLRDVLRRYGRLVG